MIVDVRYRSTDWCWHHARAGSALTHEGKPQSELSLVLKGECDVWCDGMKVATIGQVAVRFAACPAVLSNAPCCCLCTGTPHCSPLPL